MLGHYVVILTSREQLTERVPLDSESLQNYIIVGVLTSDLPAIPLLESEYDFVFTDYIGLFALRDSQHFYLYKVHVSCVGVLTLTTIMSLQCKIRVLDSFGTEPICELDKHIIQRETSLVCLSILDFHTFHLPYTEHLFSTFSL